MTSKQPKFSVLDLIPHRAPFVLLDGFLGIDLLDRGHAYILVREGLPFVQDGHLRVAGLIEHMAQATAAYAGYLGLHAKATGRDAADHPSEPNIRFLAGVNDFTRTALPALGARIDTTVLPVARLGGIELFEARCAIYGSLCARARLKIGGNDSDD